LRRVSLALRKEESGTHRDEDDSSSTVKDEQDAEVYVEHLVFLDEPLEDGHGRREREDVEPLAGRPRRRRFGEELVGCTVLPDHTRVGRAADDDERECDAEVQDGDDEPEHVRAPGEERHRAARRGELVQDVRCAERPCC